MSSERPIVMIVDDEAENRSALERSLLDDNPSWTILLAVNENDAVAQLSAKLKQGDPVDVVITDLVMNVEQSGINVLEAARKLDPFLMTILFTAKEKSLDRYRAFDSGAFDVIEKNIRGASAAREINLKARAAMRFRDWSQRINFLRRYFDPAIFEKIEREPASLALTERLVTICFWDIRGFSRLCEVLKTNTGLISGFLRDYCETGAKTIFENGGVLDKFIGDGIMALFGVPEAAHDDDVSQAESAVRAATSFRPKFDELVAHWMPKWKLHTPQKIEIGLGCGIHTGEALVGNVGTPFRDQFTALGPHVNLAARLEAKSASGQILVSQTTAARVEKKMRLKEAGELGDIKNISGIYRIYEAP